MQLRKQPDRWSCLATAFAMALEIPLHELISKIGHDGSEIWWPGQPEPQCRRAFHIQEMIDAALSCGYAVTEIQAAPATTPALGVPYRRIPFSEGRVIAYLQGSRGVIDCMVRNTGRGHAVAWDIDTCFDPNGRTLNENAMLCEYMVKSFWMLSEIKG